MHLVEWLAVLEPGLGKRDHEFFELAATLIPIFFLAGTIAGLSQTLQPKANLTHVSFAFLLLLFLILEIFAELVSVESLVSGGATDRDRYLVLSALILGMWTAGFALLWPWVQRFYNSHSFRQGAISIVIAVVVGLGLSAYGVFSVFNAVFEATHEERALRAVEKENERLQSRREEVRQVFRDANSFLKLNIRFARICRRGPEGGWTPDEHLSLRLVKFELREYIKEHHIERVMTPRERGTLDWMRGSC